MPNEYWDLTPKDSNLVETGHVASNRHTNINLSPVEAIEKARIVDARVAMSIMAAGKTCIPLNINNSEKARMIRNIGRQTHRAQQRSTHRGLDVEIEATENIINEATQAARVARSSLKSLKEQKKDAGRSPRHSQVAGNKYNNIHIPKIQGLSVRNSPVPPFQGDDTT
ncbi:hypothetical protein K443DRAFT_516940 [Laccaria amethystina LaAM-08-1]|uniref:Uncharacterized protein n=1 Tax=Laccaria amethystina LaAM-08-1 TaxID=1095629 RepID=A0A0C9WHA1_9AGAR|nr:hypothetical protein K443DRAFT_516940 [Laccaria amethystina LaAM-08-1]